MEFLLAKALDHFSRAAPGLAAVDFDRACRQHLADPAAAGGQDDRVVFAGQHDLLHSVGIDQHAGLGVTLAGAFRDIRRNAWFCEIRGDNFRCPGRGRQVRTRLSAVS
jgi:hypothetical protein